jgi:hypothetical protein
VKIELSQSGVKNFIITIKNHVMVSCKVFLFWYKVVLILRKMGWKGLIGHPKDRGKDDSNSRTNSLKPGENNVG